MDKAEINIWAQHILAENDIHIETIKYIPEGHNHLVFDLVLNDRRHAIVKFKKNSSKEMQYDSLFGGLQSLERESGIYNMVRQEAGLPAPEIYYEYEKIENPFIVVEKLPGRLWNEYIEDFNYSLSKFLISMEKLGRDIARAQTVTFPSFGNAWSKKKVLPEGIDNFADSFLRVMEMRLQRAELRNVFSSEKTNEIRKYFKRSFTGLKPELIKEGIPPVLVFTDMHAQNFLVDQDGNPEGYFDLESCQAAHPALEIYGIKFFLLNYFDRPSFDMAEESFFNGYHREGGRFNPHSECCVKLEKLLAAGRLMELSESYFNVADGLRDNWSDDFKRLLDLAMYSDQIDYMGVAEIFRSKTGQPQVPGEH